MWRRIREFFLRRNGTLNAYRFHLRYWFHPDAELAANVLATQRPSRAIQPEILNGPDVRRIVVIAPHPDDEMIGPGGTLLLALQKGCDVVVIFLTDGESDVEKAEIRRAEAARVAERLGFRARFLGLLSNELSVTSESVSALAQSLSDLRPEVVFLPFILDDNDDHRAASGILAEAARVNNMVNELEVWTYQVYSALPANVLVPLGKFASKKAEAIRMYESQCEVRDWAHFALGLNAYNTRLAPRAYSASHIEAFFVLPLRNYLDLVGSFSGDDRK